MEKIQRENKDLRRSVTELQDEVRQLKELLAEKGEELSRTSKRRQRRTLPHVNTLNQVSQAKAELKVSREKCADLQEKLQKRTDDSHQTPKRGDHVATCLMEFSEKEEALKQQFLQKEQQMEEFMKQTLTGMQEEFQKKLLEEKERNQREMAEGEQSLRQQLEKGSRGKRDDGLKKQLSTFLEHWQTEAQQWKKQQAELQQKLQEQETLLKKQVEERKEESEHFHETFQQLLSYIEKKEKKRKKGFWSRIFKCWRK